MIFSRRFRSVFLVFSLFSIPLFATEWPVSVNKPEISDLKSGFAENRHEDFSSSFVFKSDETDVVSFDNGKVIFTIDVEDSYYEDFPFVLGSTVIVSHPDNLFSVYSNLSSVNKEAVKAESVSSGDKIAKSGGANSAKTGFHNFRESLVFQLIDVSNCAVINPYLLLPRIENRFVIYPGSIFLVNKKNQVFNLDERKRIPNGTYSVYRVFVPGKMPVHTLLYVNGNLKTEIQFDMLKSKDGVLCAGGTSDYDFSQVFNEEGKQFLGEVKFVRGKNEISVSTFDYTRTERKVTFSIDVY